MDVNNKKLKRDLSLRIFFFPIFMGLFILLPAGRFFIWEVYLYFAILLVPMLWALFYFYRTVPDFLIRRMKTKERQKQQKVIVLLSSISIMATYIIPGLDFRFHWSDVPILFVIAADLVLLISYIFILYVFKMNSFASRVVEVSEGQTVISTGPYSVVRHPMYFGVLLMYLATPIALGSYWGLLPVSVLPFLLIYRIKNEEALLSRELDGYLQYAMKVKYRLIPYIW